MYLGGPISELLYGQKYIIFIIIMKINSSTSSTSGVSFLVCIFVENDISPWLLCYVERMFEVVILHFPNEA